MWEKIKKLSYIVPIMIFLTFVFIIMVMTYRGPVQETIENTKFTFESYVELSDKFEDILQRNIFKKYGFINLNGKIARILRINSLNNVQKLDNGYLARLTVLRQVDIKSLAENIMELDRFLKKRNVEFIYVLAPRKTSFYGLQLAPGYSNNDLETFDNMINTLKSMSVNTIDMNTWFKENKWTMKDVFWKTDHHWQPKAGLAAARCTMELLKKLEVAEYDEKKLHDKSYNIKVLKNWFLGSLGKRVGKDYVGVDDIQVYQPKFKTKYSYAGLKSRSTDWHYSNSVLSFDYYSKRKDYFETDPYYIYLYGNYPIQIITNTEGRNNKRVLLMGSSFKQTWVYFLTTQFKEVYAMDLRNYTDGTFAQFIEEMRPDIVLMCSSENGFTEAPLYTFGVKEYFTALEEPLGSVQELGGIKLQATGNNKNKFEVICSNLEPNQTYTLTVDNTELSGVKNSFVQMTLQNLSEDKSIYNRYFNANSNKKQKWIFTTPERSEDTYGIYLYAGVKGHTSKISVNVGGIKLRKGIDES